MQRSRAEIRDFCWRKAIRKQKLNSGWFPYLHQYSKNKIHCSCPMCSLKTNRDGAKASDLRKLASFDYQMKEFDSFEFL